jgi:hypothetical protein
MHIGVDVGISYQGVKNDDTSVRMVGIRVSYSSNYKQKDICWTVI